MAVAVILLATLGMIATVMAVVAFAPVVNILGTNEGDNIKYSENGTDTFCGNPPYPEVIANACRARDATFNAWLVLPMFMMIAIGTWAFLAVTRRDFGQFN